jgi:D-tagatose-1,6-bisphosphate aldolase subunit GatZ/KbaZ
VETLLANLRSVAIPETMLSGFLPDAYEAVRAGRLAPDAHSLILFSIRRALQPYAAACKP